MNEPIPCPPVDCPKDSGVIQKAQDEMKHRYADELNCILEFQKYKQAYNAGQPATHLAKNVEKCIGEFLKEWYANKKQYVPQILQAALQWISQQNPHDVCGLAVELKKEITGDMEIAVASLILFFNDPAEITPYTRYVVLALGIDEKKCSPCCYPTYLNCFKKFKDKCRAQIKACIKSLLPHLQQNEVDFMNDINNLGIIMDICAIRENRMADKLLWVMGERIHISMKGSGTSNEGG